MSDAVLRVRGVRVSLGGRVVVRGVDFEVAKGETLAIFGPSGAGKSTLFGAISGELPSEGDVVLGGANISRDPPWRRARRGLGYVPQGPSVLFDLTVRENLATFASLAGVRLDVADHAAELGLERSLDVPAKGLSGGERRRLELARALVTRPRVLLCDEPFTGLSDAAIEDLAVILRARAGAGVALVVTDHHVDAALRVADRALLLLDGAVEVASPAASFSSLEVVRARYRTGENDRSAKAPSGASE